MIEISIWKGVGLRLHRVLNVHQDVRVVLQDRGWCERVLVHEDLAGAEQRDQLIEASAAVEPSEQFRELTRIPNTEGDLVVVQQCLAEEADVDSLSRYRDVWRAEAPSLKRNEREFVRRQASNSLR